MGQEKHRREAPALTRRQASVRGSGERWGGGGRRHDRDDRLGGLRSGDRDNRKPTRRAGWSERAS